MSETLQLSGDLVLELQELLAGHDERCHDPLVAVQYLAAITGYMLAGQPVPDAQRQVFLDELAAFMRQVHDDVSSESAWSPEPADSHQDAFGIWHPGDP